MSQSLVHWQGSSDIWPLVFQYLSFSPIDLNNLTLTCSHFRWIAQPLLFRDLRVFPSRVMKGPSRHDHEFITKEVQRQLERLQFWALPRIAPSVMTCHIKEDPFSDFPSHLQRHICTIIDAAIATLPAFVSLRRLTFFHVPLTKERLLQVTKIKLRILDLQEYFMPLLEDGWPVLRVQDLRICPRILHGPDSPRIRHEDSWMRLMQLDALTTLRIANPDETYRVFNSPLVYSMLSLHRLDVHIETHLRPQLILVTSKLPVLRHLRILLRPSHRGTEHIVHSQSQTVLASLVSYDGPISVLVCFRLPQLRHLRVDGSITRCDPTKMLDGLALVQDMISNLDYIELAIFYLTTPLVKKLFSLLLPQATIATFKVYVACCSYLGTPPFSTNGLLVWSPYSLFF
jgi:hypothetical protein